MRFDPRLFISKSYDRSNDWALAQVKQMLKAKHYEILEHEENYGVDITAKRFGKIHYFEVETKTGYPFTCMVDYPFPTVSFLARKEKWKEQGFWYVVVCRETRAMLTCHSSIIFRPEYKEHLRIDSKERLGEDEFYRVPTELCHWSNLEGYAKAA